MKQTYIKKGVLLALAMVIMFGIQPVRAVLKQNKVRTTVSTANKRKTMTKNTFETPDFAYPKTVEENAETQYKHALQTENYSKALLAAVQMCIAENSINREDVSEPLGRFAVLGETLPSPWKELALLLEAKLYSEVYGRESYLFNGRKLPLDNYPENVMAWSGDLFARKISGLIENASASNRELSEIPLADIKDLLVNAEDGLSAGMSVADFIDFQGKNILEVFGTDNNVPLRFGDSGSSMAPKEKCRELKMSLIEDGIARNEAKGNGLLAALFCKEKLNNIGYALKRNMFLKECYDKYGETEWGAAFVNDYCAEMMYDSNHNILEGDKLNSVRREVLDRLERYLKSFPNVYGSESIRYTVANLKSEVVKINTDGQHFIEELWTCKVTMNGIYDAYLLVYKVPESIENDYLNFNKIPAGVKASAIIPVRAKGVTPDIKEVSVEMPGLEPGRYCIVVSRDKTRSGVIKDTGNLSVPTFTVSNLSFFVTTDRKEGARRLYVTEARNMQPVEGANVVWKETTYRGNGETKTFVTDKDGCVLLPTKSGSLIITKGKDRLRDNYYGYSSWNNNDKDILKGYILTDLSIYKPGDKIGFAGIYALRKGYKLEEKPDSPVKMLLLNTNMQTVDTLALVTDAYGRVKGEFEVPSDGLLGRYQIQMLAGGQTIGSSSVQVAEYKSPTFRVETGGVKGEFTLGDVLRIDGNAKTYSGMPVAGGKVEYTVRYMPWRWWYGGGSSNAEYMGSATTDGDGKFVIELPTETLKDTPYSKGRFMLNVRVTNAAGETQEANGVMFSIGNAYSILPEIPAMICEEGKSVKSPVYVKDMTDHPVEKKVYFVISHDDDEKAPGKKVEPVMKGSFNSPEFKPDWNKFPSGRYKISFSLNENMEDEDNGNADVTTVIYRSDEKQPPVKTVLWVPEQIVDMKSGEKTVDVAVGSSYDNSWIYCEIDNGAKVLERKWLKVSNGILKVKVDAPSQDTQTFLHLSGMHDGDMMQATVRIVPYAQQTRIDIKTESFRDKIEPGAEEVWKFRFTENGKAMAMRPVMAVMSNKALNALNPFEWSFNPYGMLSWLSIVNISNYHPGFLNDSFTVTPKVNGKEMKPMVLPGWQLYGQSLYGIYEKLLYVTATSFNSSPRVEEDSYFAADADVAPEAMPRKYKSVNRSVKEEAASDMSLSRAEGGDSGSGQDLNKEELREIECPLAFFMPDMVTDGDGVATLKFKVPQFNGTWQFQIAGYDSEMRGAVKVLDAVASKKVMIQMNAPRFLRTGDKAMISATMYNNSDEAMAMTGMLEILGADGKVLRTLRTESEEIGASGQRTFTIDYAVPSDESEIRIRAFAEGGGHRDGEQTVVAVLPSSTPVLESRPFYAGAGEGVIKAEIPAVGKDATVTLQYCGNPIWECVTALPAIVTPQSDNILARINVLYGISIASGLIRQYPEIGKALKLFASAENVSDSTLISNLTKNQNIKIVGLNNTPWVNSAQDETRRMGSLIEYTDTKKCEMSIRTVMKLLSDRQNNDGGWSWCPEMPTSSFITGRVLLHFAMLKGMGYLPEGAEAMAKKAFRYVDKELVKDWERNDKKYFSVSGMLNYLYVKSFFPEFKDEPGFAPLRAKAERAIAEEWKGFDIYDKATAVTYETRNGKKQLAGQILESIRQYASVSPEKGMWFANQEGRFSAWNPLITTAQVLEAYGEASPKSEAVDKLRQWLLMSKQTQDWGEMNGTAEVIQALLSTGSDWITETEPAEVTVGGHPVEIPSRSKLVDSFTLTLTPEQTSLGTIEIHKRSAGPSWGGVVSQYVAPILDVKEDRIPQLGISKAVYAIVDEDGSSTGQATTRLNVGDKVRVTLTITCVRDMDYVAVMDGRSACLEPADQISGYTSSDGVWFYREVRNESTNLFIPYLSKGTHVISYDCYVDRAGDYTLGIASAQSQYAPTISAHSAGVELRVR